MNELSFLNNNVTLQNNEHAYILECIGTILMVIFLYRHPDPKSRPQFGQILKLMTDTNGGYLLGWSNEDKQISDEDATKLGTSLQCAHSLYLDLQYTYTPKA